MESMVRKTLGNKKFWKGKRVWVTGYEGFLGSHLTKALIGLQAKVVGLDIRTNRRDTILSKGDLKKIKIMRGSVSNFTLVERILKNNKIEIVFHLAAEAIVGNCLENPLRTFSTNIQGTWNILEAARGRESVKVIIVASSDKAYGIHKQLPYKEDAALNGKHPYDASKSCADILAHMYAHTYRVPVAITRCGNIYGPGDFNFSRVVPDAARCALGGRTLKIRSNGKFTRDYIYVGDIVRGYLLLAEQFQKLKLSGEAFNFSDESPLSVIDLTEKIYRCVGVKPKYKILNQADNEIQNQYLDSRKAKRALGWKPRFTLKQGLNKTLEWYAEFVKK